MRCCAGVFVAVVAFSQVLQAQIVVPDARIRPIPQPIRTDFRIKSVDANADVRDQVAKIQFKQVFENTGSGTVEAQFLFPLPDDAAISELTLLYDGKELPGRLLRKDEARRIYEEIVRRNRDPALLEYMGQGLFQTSVFPIPPRAERTVEIRYSQLLRKSDSLVDFLLPLGSFKHANKPIETLNISLKLETAEPIKALYSPTHEIRFERPDDRRAAAKLSLTNVTGPVDLRVLHSTQGGPVGMNLLSYRPSSEEDGYFMLLASPELGTTGTQAIPKTTIIVVDRSGSMSGPKIQQAREAVKFFLGQLKPDDTFNIVAYDSTVESFRPELQKADNATIQQALGFADGLNSGGGTNIRDALQAALRMLVDDQRPSYVLFLTDGQPTVGETNEMKIVAAAKEADKVHARIFNFGVGHDVNSRLLDRLSRELRGQSVYVRPNENIEVAVSSLAKKIGAPLLTNIAVNIEFDGPNPANVASPIHLTYPRQLTDLFAGEQLVWVGRYRRKGDVKAVLSGGLAGEQRSFAVAGQLVEKSSDDTNGFVEKVWATRRIGEIIDELDLNGQNKELVDELVELSTKHGILTPYTSFLADERVDLADREGLMRRAGRSAESRLSLESGVEGFAQRRIKSQLQRSAAPLNAADSLKALQDSGALAEEEALADGKTRVQSIGRKTFYWKKERWQDADVTPEKEQQAKVVQQFSDEYFELAARENGKYSKFLAQNGTVLLNIDGEAYLVEQVK